METAVPDASIRTARWQAGHRRSSRAPQPAQKAASSGLARSHWGQAGTRRFYQPLVLFSAPSTSSEDGGTHRRARMRRCRGRLG